MVQTGVIQLMKHADTKREIKTKKHYLSNIMMIVLYWGVSISLLSRFQMGSGIKLKAESYQIAPDCFRDAVN